MVTINGAKIAEDHYNSIPLSEFFSFDIRPYISIMKFDSGEHLLHEGENPRFLYYLIDGRAKLFLSHENGRVSLINFLNAPCFIGEMELLGAQEAAKGVTAITPCTCYAIHATKCKDKMLNDTRFLRHLCLFIGQKTIENTYNYVRHQTYPLEVRLANFILLTSCNQMYRERHTEVSEYLGVTYRHLLYVLAGLVKRGVLRKTESGYYIQDLDSLKKIAGRD